MPVYTASLPKLTESPDPKEAQMVIHSFSVIISPCKERNLTNANASFSEKHVYLSDFVLRRGRSQPYCKNHCKSTNFVLSNTILLCQSKYYDSWATGNLQDKKISQTKMKMQKIK